MTILTRCILALCLVFSLSSVSPAATRLNALFMSQAAYSEADVRAMTKEFQNSHPEIDVHLEFVPYEALHDKIVAASGAGDRGYDVVLFDVIWPAEFGRRGFLLDLSDRIDPRLEEQIFPGAWTTVTYRGKRYGMPWILDTKYLFYNREILNKAGISAPPKTWQELYRQAAIIKKAGLLEYPIVASWSQSEAMICDYTTLTAAFGGSFFDDDGKVAFQRGGAKKAVEFMVRGLREGLVNPSSREYLEEDVRKSFSNGDAAFALNWTYMFAMTRDPKESNVVGKVGVVPAPGVEGVSTASAVNGSMGLGIPANSSHVDAAWSYISFLTSQAIQNRYARLSLPIWKGSYNDPAVTTGQKALVDAAGVSLGLMYPRPQLPAYTELSTILQRYIHQALLLQTPVDDALVQAVRRSARIR